MSRPKRCIVLLLSLCRWENRPTSKSKSCQRPQPVSVLNCSWPLCIQEEHVSYSSPLWPSSRTRQGCGLDREDISAKPWRYQGFGTSTASPHTLALADLFFGYAAFKKYFVLIVEAWSHGPGSFGSPSPVAPATRVCAKTARPLVCVLLGQRDLPCRPSESPSLRANSHPGVRMVLAHTWSSLLRRAPRGVCRRNTILQLRETGSGFGGCPQVHTKNLEQCLQTKS